MFVYLKADEGKIVVSIDDSVVGSVNSARELADLFRTQGVTLDSEIYNSSSIDFADEYGFESEGDAHEIIEQALELIGEQYG